MTLGIGDFVTINGQPERIGLCRRLAGVVFLWTDERRGPAYLVRLSGGMVVRELEAREDFDQAVLAYEREARQ